MKYAIEEEILAQQPAPIKYNNEVIYPDKVRINLEYMERLDVRIYDPGRGRTSFKPSFSINGFFGAGFHLVCPGIN